MSRGPLTGVDIERISPVMALTRLQEMLGRKVIVELNDYSHFFGCGFAGILKRVDTIPSSETGAINVSIDSGSGFFLDPNECMIYLADLAPDGAVWLEFHRPTGPVIAIRVITSDLHGDHGASHQCRP